MANGDPNRAFELIMSMGNLEDGEGMMEGEYGEEEYADEEGEGSMPIEGGNMFE